MTSEQAVSSVGPAGWGYVFSLRPTNAFETIFSHGLRHAD